MLKLCIRILKGNFSGPNHQYRRPLMAQEASESNNRKPEHPRHSNTDDVECFFSMMTDSIGQNLPPSKLDSTFTKLMENSLNAWIRTYHFIIIPQLAPVYMKDHCQVLISLHQRRKGFQEENSQLLLHQLDLLAP